MVLVVPEDGPNEELWRPGRLVDRWVRDCPDTLINMKRPSLRVGSSFPDSKHRAPAEH